MPRQRTQAPARASRRSRAGSSVLVQTAERMVGQIEELVTEIATLREDNEALRAELRDAVQMLQRASDALGDAASAPRRKTRGRAPRAREEGRTTPARGARRERGAGRSGRATPAGVTVDVVRAVMAKLGEATASEIAAEITRAGAPVSGRAVRFLAERAGAQTTVGEDGQRRYRL